MKTDLPSADQTRTYLSEDLAVGPSMPIFNRVRRRLIGVSFTMVFLAGCVATVMFAVNLIATRAAAVPDPVPANLIAVSTSRISMQESYQIERRFVGQVEAGQSTQIAFEGAGTLHTLMFEEGDSVAAGEVLATLDRRILEADVTRLEASKAAIEAQAELARRTNARQKELNARGFASNQALDQSMLLGVELLARIAELDAAILAAKIRLEKTEIRAPFEGVITARFLDEGTIMSPGQPVYALLETVAPVFRVGIDPQLADDLELNSSVTVETAEQIVSGRAVSLSADVDPVTRSRILRIELPRNAPVLFGDTGTVALTQDISKRGAWIPLGALKDGVRGLWEILSLDDGDDQERVVGLEAVEIIYSDAERAFVTGTFEDGTEFILQGTHRVVPGQRVKVEG